ncbi:MAG: glycosyltransferase family 39 protein [Saprospiraceae bacterium]|nr:glycosyltransferase family 39 protein [Saprospiraceae bacterium]
MLSKRINYVLFAVAIYFPIFWNLDSLGLQIFDESHNAVNAIEMMQNGNYFVRYYDGAPDLWEPKPPLLIWLQIFFIKLLGLTELSIRLPAALATVGLIAFIIWFFKKNWQDTEGGVFAALTIVTSTGFISYHVSRNGDHDALVTFFLVGYMLFFWNWLKSQNQKHLLFSILFIVLAVFTKSIIGVIFLPGLFLYVLLTGQLFKVIGNLRFWIFSITGFLIVASYYLICEKLHPGHWTNVWNMEFLPRYTGSFKDGVNGWKPSFLDDKWYWVKKIYSKTYPIVWTLPLSIVCILKNTNKERRQFWLLLLCCSSTFLYIISNGCVIDWYDAPVYPILAMMSGLILSDIYNGLKTNLQNNISSPPPSTGLLRSF